MQFILMQFCQNGHNLSVYDQSSHPMRDYVMGNQTDWERRNRQPFCSICGAPTLVNCPSCTYRFRVGKRPAYCAHCGKPFAWTTKALADAQSYADSMALPAEEKRELKATIDEVVASGPKSEVAAHRFKRLLCRLGKDAGEALNKILVDTVSETVKKVLLSK